MYSIAIDGRAGVSGALKLNWRMAQASDQLAAATEIADLGSLTATNVAASKEKGEPMHVDELGATSIAGTDGENGQRQCGSPGQHRRSAR